jgi:Arc-like DNA binding domain
MATLTVRIPDEMHERVKRAADEDVRSVNEEIAWFIKTGLDGRPTPAARRESAEGITGMHWDNLGSGGEGQ